MFYEAPPAWNVVPPIIQISTQISGFWGFLTFLMKSIAYSYFFSSLIFLMALISAQEFVMLLCNVGPDGNYSINYGLINWLMDWLINLILFSLILFVIFFLSTTSYLLFMFFLCFLLLDGRINNDMFFRDNFKDELYQTFK